MNKPTVIFGYSGHSYVVLDILTANQYDLIGYCDTEIKSYNPYGLQYLGTEHDSGVYDIIKQYDAFLGIGNNTVRGAIFQKLSQHKINCPTAIHQRSAISPLAKVASGSVVMAGAVVNAMAVIGEAVICNSGCIIEHECIIDNFAHIAPGAVLAGNVSVGKYSFIGANAVVRQGITIGRDVIIGAGAVVTKNIPDGVTVYGNPANIYLK